MRHAPQPRSEDGPASMVVYRRGPTWQPACTLGEQPTIVAHACFLDRLAGARCLLRAGPTVQPDQLVADDPVEFVSLAVPPAEARRLLADDPGVLAGLLCCEVHAWKVPRPWWLRRVRRRAGSRRRSGCAGPESASGRS